MDEFGVLTERFGLKPQGKGAPMAASKRTSVNNNNAQTWNFGVESNTNPKSSSFVDDHSKAYNGGVSDDYDDIFGGGSLNSTKQSGAFGGSTAAGSSFDYDSLFSGSNSNSNSNPTGKSSLFNAYDNDDIFGGMPGVSSSSFASKDAKSDDIFGSFAPATKQSAPIDDFLGGFVGAESKPKSSTSKMSSGFDDLIPGFGASSPPNNGRNVDKHRTTTQSTKPTFTSPEDPFIVLESTSASNSTSTSNDAYASSDLLSDPLERVSKINNSGDAKPPRLKSPPRATQISKEYNGAAKSSGVSSIDELEDFAMGRVQNSVNGRSKSSSSGERQGSSINRASSHSENDLESFFSMGARSNSAPRSRATTSDSLFDAPKPNNNRGGTRGPQPQPQVPPKMSSGTSPSIKKSSSASGIFDDLSSMFDGAQISGEFQEVEGESEERRNARFGRLQRTNERMAKAVADMNQRDFQSQQEQEERRRIAEAMDADIKRWAAGKEGNMRALLSSLQHVLWPECGWEPVSLTDIITSTSVKKVYWKATLCIHPDKVQQKGASLQQKYTAEKVFDILKEAWNKFKKEELS